MTFTANERNSSINSDLVGDPMETYFYGEAYETRTDSSSDNPIYSKDSFIKGAYPLEEELLDYNTARVIIIQFKEDIDFNCILNNEEKPYVELNNIRLLH